MPESLVPIYLYIDGGTSQKEQSLDCGNWQPALGKGTVASNVKLATDVLKKMRNRTGQKQKLVKSKFADKMKLNYTGRSLSNRFLFSMILKRHSKTFGQGWKNWTTLMAKNFKDLYDNGVEICGKVWYFAPLGMKADLPMVTKTSNSKRSHGSIRNSLFLI